MNTPPTCHPQCCQGLDYVEKNPEDAGSSEAPTGQRQLPQAAVRSNEAADLLTTPPAPRRCAVQHATPAVAGTSRARASWRHAATACAALCSPPPSESPSWAIPPPMLTSASAPPAWSGDPAQTAARSQVAGWVPAQPICHVSRAEMALWGSRWTLENFVTFSKLRLLQLPGWPAQQQRSTQGNNAAAVLRLSCCGHRSHFSSKQPWKSLPRQTYKGRAKAMP